MLLQWDDHEVTNNWSPSRPLSRTTATREKSHRRCSRRAPRAPSTSMTPIRATPEEPARVYRKIAYGPLLDVFFLDMRTYRGPNGRNRQSERGPESRVPRAHSSSTG